MQSRLLKRRPSNLSVATGCSTGELAELFAKRDQADITSTGSAWVVITTLARARDKERTARQFEQPERLTSQCACHLAEITARAPELAGLHSSRNGSYAGCCWLLKRGGPSWSQWHFNSTHSDLRASNLKTKSSLNSAWKSYKFVCYFRRFSLDPISESNYKFRTTNFGVRI